MGVYRLNRGVNSVGRLNTRRVDVANGLLNSLIAYWKGDEASGNLIDAHTNGLDLTDVNTVTNAAGKVYATARQYTRANSERHERASEALLQVGDIDFTISAWVNMDSLVADTATVIGKYRSGTAAASEFSLYYSATAASFRFLVENNQIVDSTNVTSAGVWYLVICWHDSVNNTINIQVDDGAVNSANYSGGVTATTEMFIVGAWNNVTARRYFNGRISPAMFWKSAGGAGGVLTANQRTALWNGGNGLPYSSFTI